MRSFRKWGGTFGDRARPLVAVAACACAVVVATAACNGATNPGGATGGGAVSASSGDGGTDAQGTPGASADSGLGGTANQGGVDATVGAPGIAGDSGSCRTIVPVPPCSGMAVLRGGDGFVGLASDGTVNVYDDTGAIKKALGLAIDGGVSPQQSPLGETYAVQAAAQAGGVIAALSVGQSSFEGFDREDVFLTASAGANLKVNPNASVYSPSLAVGPDGTIFVTSWESPDPTANVPAAPVIRSYDPASGQIRQTVWPTAPGYQLAAPGLVAGADGTVYARFDLPNPSPDIDTPARVTGSLVIAFGANLTEKARWSSPTSDVVEGFAVSPAGVLYLVGRQIGLRSNPDQVWIDALDGASLTPLWTAPRVGGDLEAFGVDIASSGDLVVAGSDLSTATLWVELYDTTGAPLWSSRAERVLAAYQSTSVAAVEYPYDVFDVASQSDGGIFLSQGYEVAPGPCSPPDAGLTEAAASEAGSSDAGGGEAGVGIPGAVYVKPSNTKPPTNDAYGTPQGFEFGFAIALEGNTLAVGAPGEPSKASGVNGDQTDTSTAGAGAVYVFTQSNGAWSQQAYLKASSGGTPEKFGSAVSLDGDTLVVGAPSEASNATGVNGNQQDVSSPGAGAVYVFTQSNGTWSQQAYIKAATVGTGACGTSVAVSGDTLVFGCPQDTSGAILGRTGGSLYVFTRSGTTWSQQAYLTAQSGGVGSANAVSLQGDELVAGAPGINATVTLPQPDGGTGPSETGAVYTYSRSGSQWTLGPALRVLSNSNDNGGLGQNVHDGQFGNAVALSGSTVAVGAPLESPPGSTSSADVGAAYAFVSGSGGSWTQQAHLQPATQPAALGYDVALDGDTLVFGAPTQHPGTAYVYARSGSTWSSHGSWTPTNLAASSFGYAAAVSGATVAIGDPSDTSSARGVGGDPNDTSATQSGAVYVLPMP